MAQQPETIFKTKVLKRLKEIPNTWVVKVQQQAIRGTPDLLICHDGIFFAWELKASNGRVSKLQQFTLDQIDEAGGVARVVTPENFEDMIAELRCTRLS